LPGLTRQPIIFVKKFFHLRGWMRGSKPAHDGERVITGLDPVIHHLREKIFAKSMDAQVKPG
jgi:hypothetical protein